MRVEKWDVKFPSMGVKWENSRGVSLERKRSVAKSGGEGSSQGASVKDPGTRTVQWEPSVWGRRVEGAGQGRAMGESRDHCH